MRTATLTPLLLLAACTIIAPPPPPPPAPVPVPAAPAAYGFKLDEEVKILQIEDRRQYYAPLADWGIHHPNALHRARMALALGRIGPATFDDTNGNGVRDEGERQAGGGARGQLGNKPDGDV